MAATPTAARGNPDDTTLAALLANARTIAVVGISARPERPSHGVAAYLQHAGYRIVPVNPGLTEVLGEPCHPSLDAVPQGVEVDVVDVFRRSEHVGDIVEHAIARGVRCVWLQLGVDHPLAVARARAAGILVVVNRCLKIDHARLLPGRKEA